MLCLRWAWILQMTWTETALTSRHHQVPLISSRHLRQIGEKENMLKMKHRKGPIIRPIILYIEVTELLILMIAVIWVFTKGYSLFTLYINVIYETEWIWITVVHSSPSPKSETLHSDNRSQILDHSRTSQSHVVVMSQGRVLTCPFIDLAVMWRGREPSRVASSSCLERTWVRGCWWVPIGFELALS